MLDAGAIQGYQLATSAHHPDVLLAQPPHVRARPTIGAGPSNGRTRNRVRLRQVQDDLLLFRARRAAARAAVAA